MKQQRTEQINAIVTMMGERIQDLKTIEDQLIAKVEKTKDMDDYTNARAAKEVRLEMERVVFNIFALLKGEEPKWRDHR